MPQQCKSCRAVCSTCGWRSNPYSGDEGWRRALDEGKEHVAEKVRESRGPLHRLGCVISSDAEEFALALLIEASRELLLKGGSARKPFSPLVMSNICQAVEICCAHLKARR